MSVPERMRTYSSAFAAVRVKRGSTTIIRRRSPWRAACAASTPGAPRPRCEPMYIAHLVFCMSLYELVIAP